MALVWYVLWPLGNDLRAAWANIYPNIVAALICGIPAALWAARKFVHLHRRLDHQDRKLRAIHQATGGDSDAPAQSPGPAL